MFKKVQNQITQCDIFGAEVKLNLNGKQKYQSPLGGIMTICVTCIILIIMIASSITLLSRQSYTIQSNQVINIDPSNQEITLNYFMLALFIENDFPTQTKRLYNIIYQPVTQYTLNNGTKIKIEGDKINLETCSEDHFARFEQTNSYDNIILRQQLSRYSCLPYNYSFNLSGTYRSDVFLYVKISLEFCSDIDCYTEQQLRQLFQDNLLSDSFKVNTIMLNSLVNLRSKENYQQYAYSDFYIQTSFSQKLTSKTNIYLEKQNLNIENSIFSGISDALVYNLYQVQDSKLKTDFELQDDYTAISDIYIRLAQSESFYDKKYYRFDQLFSYIGGITKFIMTLIGFFVIKYNSTGLQVQLANQLYQFDMPTNQKGNIVFSFQNLVTQIVDSLKSIENLATKFRKGAHKVMHLSKITNAFKTSQSVFKNVNLENAQYMELGQNLQTYQESQRNDQMHNTLENQQLESQHAINLDLCKKSYLEQVINIILSSQTQLNYGVNFLFKKLTRSVSKKDLTNQYTTKIFEQSTIMIQKDMDILAIMAKLQEIGKIKHILLNKTQRKVFNCLPKPVVTVNRILLNEGESINESIFANDLEGKKDNMLLKQKKSVLGNLHKFNTADKLRKLYHAYEQIKLQQSEENIDKDQHVNQRLVKLLEPTLQHSFDSLSELEILSNQLRENKSIQRSNLHTFNRPKKVPIVSLADQEELNLTIQNSIQCVKPKPKYKQQHSSLRIEEQLKSKIDFIDGSIDSS